MHLMVREIVKKMSLPFENLNLLWNVQVRDLWKWDELKYSLNVTAIAYLLLAYIVSSYQICYAFKLESPILSILPRIQIHRLNANTAACNGFQLSMDGFPITV